MKHVRVYSILRAFQITQGSFSVKQRKRANNLQQHWIQKKMTNLFKWKLFLIKKLFKMKKKQVTPYLLVVTVTLSITNKKNS